MRRVLTATVPLATGACVLLSCPFTWSGTQVDQRRTHQGGVLAQEGHGGKVESLGRRLFLLGGVYHDGGLAMRITFDRVAKAEHDGLTVSALKGKGS